MGSRRRSASRCRTAHRAADIVSRMPGSRRRMWPTVPSLRAMAMVRAHRCGLLAPFDRTARGLGFVIFYRKRCARADPNGDRMWRRNASASRGETPGSISASDVSTTSASPSFAASMPGVRNGDDASRRRPHGDARRRVLEHDARRGLRAEIARGEQEDVGRGLAARDAQSSPSTTAAKSENQSRWRCVFRSNRRRPVLVATAAERRARRGASPSTRRRPASAPRSASAPRACPRARAGSPPR